MNGLARLVRGVAPAPSEWVASGEVKDLRASVVAVCDNDTAMMANGRRPSRITGW
jgi:hypothetical protein